MKLRWPFDGNYPITQTFGENPGAYARFGLRGHNGVDAALWEGTPVLAAADGVVSKAGNDAGGYGEYIKVRHADGSETLYGHLSKRLAQLGDNVAEGQVIGKSGNTGNSSGAHLHFEYRLPGQAGNGYGGAVDPLPYLDAQKTIAPSVPVVQSVYTGTVRSTVGLNVRSGPGVGHSQVGRLVCGTKVDLVEIWGKTPDGRWVAVFHGGEKLVD